MTWRMLILLPARVLAPLLLLVIALLFASINYVMQRGDIVHALEMNESRRLAERLAAEQTRLQMQYALGNRMQVQRQVASLAIHSGTTHAFLVDRQGVVQAALSRRALGHRLEDALRDDDAVVRAALIEAFAGNAARGVTTRIAADATLIGGAPVRSDLFLLMRVDLARPLALQLAAGQGQLLRQATMTLLLAALLAGLLHLVWFRRATQLTRAVEAIGRGELDVRTGITGRDELARIGHAIDHMAVELKRRRDDLETLNAELEQRVAERTAALQAANRELESFSYSVSHDLKAPLRGIDGYSQLLLEDYRDRLDEEGRSFLANIRRGVAQMHRLIEDLLDYSRMERRPLQARTVDLQALLRAVVDSEAGQISALGAVVEQEVAPLELRVDADGLAIVLRNLLGNALKFSRDARPPRIRIAAAAAGDTLRIDISDNGIGFDMQYHDRIFDLFQRLHRADEFPGTGVGLALVKRAVQRMGGTIRADSAPGAGATFHLELPR